MANLYDRLASYVLTKEQKEKLKLKPIACKSCIDNGMSVGDCEQCLKNRAENREILETHLFIYDKRYRCYHTDEHDDFKATILRLPNEHPYLYYGIEVEVEFDSRDVEIYDNGDYDDDDDDNWKINEILDRFSEITEGMFVYEKDGSLDNGVELISRPTSYAYWTHKDTIEKLKKGFEYLREQGALWEQPTRNGMHIHISNKFFEHGEMKTTATDAMEGFDWLFQKFQTEIESLGGREYTDYCESKASKLQKSISDNYYARNFNADVKVECKLKKGGRIPCGDHYSAVNLSGATLEARVFKSTTDYKQIMANIELVRNFAHAVRDNSIDTTLNSILHTKENLYLDDIIRKVRMNCKKNNKEFDLERVNDNEIEVVVEQ